ncbi:hypothetical protein HYX16_02805 [Candidatus Woesearchaeota archaeon]|nr:hypothetical protein [Candidatus Woesearchaeota archaeon]
MIKSLISELNKVKNRIGLVSGTLTVNQYDDAEENVAAYINPANWNIELNLKKDFNPIQDRRQKAYARKKKIENGKKQLLEDILHHELAHWELPFNSGFGCPYDPYNHDLILEAVKKALPKDKQEQASYVANAFEDLIINARCKEFTGNFSGQVLFWSEQGQKTEDKKYTPFYDAFVQLNMYMWGDNVDKALLKRHSKNDEKVKKAVEKAIEDLDLKSRKEIVSSLFEKDKWPEMASKFTKALAPLLETKPTEKLSAYQSSEEDKEKKQEGSGIEKKLFTKEGKEEVAFERYSHNKELSTNIPKEEQLDSLYRRLTKKIPVKVEAIVKERSLPIAPLNYRPFDEEKDDIAKLKPTKIYVTEDGLTFGHQKQQISITAKSKVQRKSFPDFKMIVLDNSGSMREGINGDQGNKTFIPWGDNSKYHYALLGFYGVEQFLQAQGIAQYIGHGLSLFSASTRYQETDFKDVQKLRKMALSPDFGPDTRIDAKTLLNALKGKESFVLSISDGEISNWDESKKEFEKLAKDNYFAHIQIGGKNRFTQDLETAGFPVSYVSNGDELSKLMVNVAQNTYRRFVHEK